MPSFPKTITVVVEKTPHDEDPFFLRVAMKGIQDRDIQPGQMVATYGLLNVQHLKEVRLLVE